MLDAPIYHESDDVSDKTDIYDSTVTNNFDYVADGVKSNEFGDTIDHSDDSHLQLAGTLNSKVQHTCMQAIGYSKNISTYFLVFIL